MSQAKLNAAREYIQEKDYSTARTILKTIIYDDTAAKWLEKLDDLAPETNRRELSFGGFLLRLFMVIFIVVGIFGGGAYLYLRNAAGQSFAEDVPELRATLNEYCASETRVEPAKCQAWIEKMVSSNDFMAPVIVKVCKERHSKMIPESFVGCLLEYKISTPLF